MTGVPAARVGVCIPAFDEAEGVARLCRSIRSCDYAQELVRVVVAVDGGDPAVGAAARRTGSSVIELVPNQGSYAARNAAVDALPDVDVVLFVDADCTVAEAWIAAHVRALAGADLSGGAVRFTFLHDVPRPAEWVDATRHLQQERYVTVEGYTATCNLAVRRAVLDTIRFDPDRRTGGDHEFCRQATGAGYRLVYTPDAAVDHPARPTTRDLLQKVHRLAGGIADRRDDWVRRGVTRPRPNRAAYRRARAAGYDVGPFWGLRACAIDYYANRLIARVATRALASGGGVIS